MEICQELIAKTLIILHLRYTYTIIMIEKIKKFRGLLYK